MTEIRLNGREMVDRVATHAYLKQKLALPEYYGNNLDALWDCLSTDFSLKKIVIIEPENIIENLGSYGELLLNVFNQVAEENIFIKVDIEWLDNSPML